MHERVQESPTPGLITSPQAGMGELPSKQLRPSSPAPDTEAGGRKERPPRGESCSRQALGLREPWGGALHDTPPGPCEGQEAEPRLLDCSQKVGCPANPSP